jgi:hypothetical protein
MHEDDRAALVQFKREPRSKIMALTRSKSLTHAGVAELAIADGFLNEQAPEKITWRDCWVVRYAVCAVRFIFLFFVGVVAYAMMLWFFGFCVWWLCALYAYCSGRN